jgi:hypothetical protein
VDEIWAGDTLLAFDGRVLEIFGFPGHESLRFHVRNIEVEFQEPDRKGRRWLRIKPASSGSGGCMFEVKPEDLPQIEPFIDRVLAAIPEV